MGLMTEITKRLRIGKNMREAYDYINQHPGELVYVIKLQFGYRSSRIIDRLVDAKMIEVKDGRCYSLNSPAIARHLHLSQETRGLDQVRQYSYDLALSVPCPNRECLVPAGEKCTGLTRYKRERIGPHYERLIILVYCMDMERRSTKP